MAFQDQRPEDIRATLAVSQEEAQFGSSRVINLPGGSTVTVVIPAGIRDGQDLYLAGQGIASSTGGVSGDLILRVSVIAVGGLQPAGGDDFATQRVRNPASNSSAPAGFSGDGNRPGWSAPARAELANGGFSVQSPSYPGSGGYVDQRSGQAGGPASGGHAHNQVYVQQPPQENYTLPPSQLPKPKRNGAITGLILVIVLVLIVGSGLIFYLGYYQPQQTLTLATQTAQTQVAATAQASAGQAQGTAQAAASSTAHVQATVQAYQSIYTQATSGTPVVNDPLSSPTITPLWNLTLGSTANGACVFTNGSYHVTMPNAGFFQPCYALNTNYSTFAFQVDMTIGQGDQGGVLLRANTAHTNFYLFRLSVDGSFDFYRYANLSGSQAVLLLTGTSKAMKGLNQSNEITVVAQRTTMYFYLNKQYVGSTNDNTYTAGEVGVFAESAKNATDVAFSNAKIWTL